MRILHIVNWYPSIPTPNQAPWIKNQIDLLNCIHEQEVVHLQVDYGPMKWSKGLNKDGSRYLLLSVPLNSWWLIECLSSLLLLWLLFISKRRSFFDIINFHIAYPNCTYLHLFTKIFRAKLIITEHWSAYHFNFGSPRSLSRIQRIFRNNVPVITVSEALRNDIENFAKTTFENFIVPNVISHEFRFDKRVNRKDLVFFAISQWKWPKDPFTLLKAWKNVIDVHPQAILQIGGYGPQYEQMRLLVKDLQLTKVTFFLGQLKSKQVATRMRKSTAILHCSAYETFSVVCAESLCCGTPVVASNVGGITEYIDNSNGILVKTHCVESWTDSIIQMINKSGVFDRELISENAFARFGEPSVREAYNSALGIARRFLR